MAEDAVSASAKGATFLILLQIGSRALTFALNQVLVRFQTAELLGMGILLEVYTTSCLYFSRETLRYATQRRSGGGVQAAVNLSYVAILAGLPIGAITAHFFLFFNYPDVPYLATALRMNQLTVLIELLSEPAYVAVQQKMLYKTRAMAEAVAVVSKTVTMAGLVFWSRHQDIDLGVLPFTAAEMAYSGTLTLVYLFLTVPVARRDKFSLLPARMPSSSSESYFLSLFSKPLLALSASLYLQTGVKWLLTEGDRIMISMFATWEDQGTYGISANYGGLIARMLFRPIEDSARNLFANLCAPSSAEETKAPGQATSKKAEAAPTSTSGKDVQKPNLNRAGTVLTDILRIYTIASVCVVTLGPPAAPSLLHLVAGSKWTDSGAGDVLATYCHCIPLLALNGVSEAFVSATASSKELRWQSAWMTGFSAGFILSAYVFLHMLQLGAQGLVWANCVNMGLRTIFNLWFATGWFSSKGVKFSIKDLLPNPATIAAAAIVRGALEYKTWAGVLITRYGIWGELGRVAGVGVLFIGVVVMTERRYLYECYRRYRV